jgi:hypothetical protein
MAVDSKRKKIENLPIRLKEVAAPATPAAKTDGHFYSKDDSGLESWLSQYVVCTSTTRPASPVNGLCIYETDTKRDLFYNGTAWRYRPGTVLASVTITSAQNNVVAGGDLTGMSVTFDALGGDVNISLHAPIQNTGGIQVCSLTLKEGSTSIEDVWTQVYHPSTGLCTHDAQLTVTPSAGSHTYKIINGNAATQIHHLANANRRGQLIVKAC